MSITTTGHKAGTPESPAPDESAEDVGAPPSSGIPNSRERDASDGAAWEDEVPWGDERILIP